LPAPLADPAASRPRRAVPRRALVLDVAGPAAAALLAGCATDAGPAVSDRAAGTSLTVYSGRQEVLVGPLLEIFAKASGVNLRIRYGDSAELAAALLEEGQNSPADVFFSQDAGALGALAQRDLLATLPDELLNRVSPRFRSPAGLWVGTTARARVVAYNTEALKAADLPDSILGFTDPKWKGRIGWAPPNASFQAFITAFRLTAGEAAARSWIEGIKANNPRSYVNNIAALHAVARGEIQVAFVNHYYLHAIQADQGKIPVANYHPRDAGVGAMINVAGTGILKTARNAEGARGFIAFLLGPEAQRHFAEHEFEYPVVAGAPAPKGATPLAQIRAPDIDLSNLADLQGTLALLRSTGVL
jgi:iron(III) transport system substrate-binding protein